MSTSNFSSPFSEKRMQLRIFIINATFYFILFYCKILIKNFFTSHDTSCTSITQIYYVMKYYYNKGLNSIPEIFSMSNTSKIKDKV